MNQILLSILIPTLPSRRVVYNRLLDILLPQIEPFNNEVELITFLDNKKICIGTKRNELVNQANGNYLVFIDDDDIISDNYVELIVNAIKTNQNVDVITYKSLCYEETNPPFICNYSLKYATHSRDVNTGAYTAKPAHTMIWKSSLAKMVKFPTQQCGEDYLWSCKICQFAKSEFYIDEILYHYHASREMSETQGIKNMNHKFVR